jgi:uncharacterized metal-binding protein
MNMDTGNETVALLTCSSVSNTARIAAQAAIVLLQYQPGRIEWVQVKQPEDTILEAVRSADRVLVLDGCAEGCGIKKLGTMGITFDHQVIVTEVLGIKKSMADVKYEEVEKIVQVIDQL